MINSYKDLLVWQRSMDLVEAVYRVTARLPASEQFGLTAQMRRSAISIPSILQKDMVAKQLANTDIIFRSVAVHCLS